MFRLHSKLSLELDEDLSYGKSRNQSLRPSLSEHGARVGLMFILLAGLLLVLAGLLLVQNGVAIAQGAAPNATRSEVLKACDLAAASPYDKQRPADVPGVFNNAFNPSVAIPICEAAVRAAPQDPRMLFELGLGYHSVKRFTEAVSLYKQAAQMGNALAANALALMYANGEGVEVDPKAEFYYLNQAARAGLSIAQYNLYTLYLFGASGVPKNGILARQWVSLAAQDNYRPAMYDFGVMLDKGVGGQQDSFEARKWIEKAANANFPFAIAQLGWMFQKGRGGPQDFEEARRLFKLAIALGETQYAAKYLAALDQTHPAAAQGALAGTQAPLSGPTQPAFVAGAITFVMVKFQQTVTNEDFTAFLDAYKVSIAESPETAAGFYKLRLATPIPASELTQLLESMKGQPRIVANAVAN